MLVATQGLVLHTTAYSESSVIVKIFTEQLGVRSYIVKGVRKPGSRAKQSLFSPLSWLDMVVYDNPHKEINYIKEYTPLSSNQISYNESCMAIVFFMDELLYRTLRENEPMPELFHYVVEVLEGLSQSGTTQHSNNHIASLPINFLLTISRHLGIAPLDNHSLHEPVFSLSEGKFVRDPYLNIQNPDFEIQNPPPPSDILDTECSIALHNYLESAYSDSPLPVYSAALRSRLLSILIDYYKLHLSYFGNFKSHEILHGVLA